MRQTMKRTLALVMALLLALPTFAAADTEAVPAEAIVDAAEYAAAAPDALPEDDPAGEGVITPELMDSPAEQESEAKETPVRVRAVVTPESAAVAVYTVDEETPAEEQEPVKPEKKGEWLLLPGEYTYSASAEGYAPAERVRFVVPETDEVFELHITLKQAQESGEVPPEEPESEPESAPEETEPAQSPVPDEPVETVSAPVETVAPTEAEPDEPVAEQGPEEPAGGNEPEEPAGDDSQEGAAEQEPEEPAEAEAEEPAIEQEMQEPAEEAIGEPAVESAKDEPVNAPDLVVSEQIDTERVTAAALYAAGAEDELVSVYFTFEPEDAWLEVYAVATEVETEPEYMFPEDDNLYLLPPGEYTYSAEAEGYVSIVDRPFTVAPSEDSMSISFAMEEEGAAEEELEPGDSFTSWTALQAAINTAADGAVLSLASSLCAEDEGAAALEIPEGKNITLDLHGNELRRSLREPVENGCVIVVKGSLTLADQWGGGAVTGGNNTGNGGGVYVAPQGSLTVKGASIAKNRASGMGGGVYAAGELTLVSGSVVGNAAGEKGGGVYFASAFDMQGGSLSGNTPEDVRLEKPMRLSGPARIANAYLAVPGAFQVSGQLQDAVIALSLDENAVGDEAVAVTGGLSGMGLLDNFKMYKSGECNISLDDAGEVVIRKYAAVTLYAGDGTTASRQARVPRGTDYVLPGGDLFTAPEGQPFQAWLMEDGTNKAPGDTIHVTEDITLTAQWALTWAGLQDMIDKAGWGDTLRLPSGLLRASADEALTIPEKKKITLDLAGYSIDGAGIGDKAVIYVQGELILKDSVGGGKITGGREGGVVVQSGAFTLQSGEISGNSSQTLGGGVLVMTNGSFLMQDENEGPGGTISGNSAQSGGGVGVQGGGFELASGVVSGNSAAENGGGVAATGGRIALKGGRVSGNTAQSGGGVSAASGVTLDMSAGTISGNSATANGGGLLLKDGAKASLTGGAIEKNSAGDGQGGGLYIDRGAFTLSGVSVTGNSASLGGGVAVNAGSVTLSGGGVSFNIAASQGGGLYVHKGTANLAGGSVTANEAQYGGGAFISEGALVMPENILTQNQASVGGAGVAFSNMQPELPALACVRGNLIGGAEADYYLTDGAAFRVTEQLDGAYRVYLSAQMEAGRSRVVASGEKLSRDNFISADTACVASRNESGDILLGAPVRVLFSAGEGGGAMDGDTVARGGAYTLPAAQGLTAPDGLELQGWKIDNAAYWDKETKAVGYNLAVTDEMLSDGALQLEAQWGAGVLYVDENGTNRTAALVRPLSDCEGQGAATLEAGWYLADGATFDERVTISGDVNIIIDNVHTTSMRAGILLPAGSSLTVWGEGGWETASGKLVATGSAGSAGIGGATQLAPGAFTLRSGEVEATGGTNGAGVGGGDGVPGGTVVIHGGKLTARGGTNGAGIGGGRSAAQGGAVSIYGGAVFANGGQDGAGIGGGKGGGGAQVSVAGATVSAEGGTNGAGIGGGAGGAGGSVSVTLGANVTATAGKNPYQGSANQQPQAIGHGFASGSGLEAGGLTLYGGCTVDAGDEASRAERYTQGQEDACRKNYVQIASTEDLPAVFTIVREGADDDAADVQIRNEKGESVNAAGFRDRISVQICPREEYHHYEGIEIRYTYHGETLTLEDYDVVMNGRDALVTFEMPKGSVTLTPKIKTDVYRVTVNVVAGEGTAYASVDGAIVLEAPVGKSVHIHCAPASKYWFLDIQQRDGQPESEYTPYVSYRDAASGRTVVLTTDLVDGDENVQSFTMPEADVTVDLTFRRQVYYVDKDGVSQSQKYYHTVSADDTVWSGGGVEDSWYYVGESMTLNNRVNLTCQVDLILAPGVTLTCAKGLNVTYKAGGKLYIYEEEKNGGGHLYCDASGEDKCAGIGGDKDNPEGGTVVVYGGKVTAKGGHKAAGIGGSEHGALYEYEQRGGSVTATGGKYGAGVGGGEGYGGSVEDGISGSVSISGGTLNATGGGYAAGIGGGQSMHQGGAVYISGGTVYARGGRDGAGIGGGEEFDPMKPRQVGGNGGNVYISGGYVEARSGGGDGSAGIGGGQDGKGGHLYVTGGEVRAYGGDDGAGIGGHNNHGGSVDISGGWVYAYGGDNAAGIGGGDDSGLGTVSISGGYVYAEGGDDGAGIGTGCWGKGGTINITGGNVTAYGGENAAGVGGGDGNWLYGGGAVDSITIRGCNLYAYGEEKAIGKGDGGKGSTSISLGSGAVYVSNTKGSGASYVSGDKAKAVKENKYAEFIYCPDHTISEVYRLESVDDEQHHVVGKCGRCNGVVEVSGAHVWTFKEYAPVDENTHRQVLECQQCHRERVLLEEKHYYFFSEYEGTGKVCHQCKYEHPDLTVRLLPGDLPGAEPIELSVEYNTYFTYPQSPWELKDGYEFFGWSVPNWRYIRGWEYKELLLEDLTLTATWKHVHDGVEFYPWVLPDSLPPHNSYTTSYYLACDVTLEGPWDPNSTTDLCLNGHTLTSKNGDVIVMERYNELTIWDEGGGSIVSLNGKGISVYGGSILTLKGGTITASQDAVHVGGWSSHARFNMEGGRIEGCGGSGVCLYLNGIFNLSGGVITGNHAENGAGVRIEDNCEFNMTGGTITDNHATGKGGGVYLPASKGRCTLTGGTITGNSALGAGGGVYVAGEGGLFVSGDPVVTGNTSDNVYLARDARIGVSGALGKDMNVCVSTEAEPTDGAPVPVTSGLSGNGPAVRFRSDNAKYTIKTVDREAAMGEFGPSVARCDANGGTGTMPDVEWPEGEDFILPECGFSGPRDFSFVGWSVNGGAVPRQPGEAISASDNDNLTLTAQWQDIHDGIVFEPWESANSLPEESGSYVLMQDVYLTEEWSVDRSGMEINLCLNGYHIQVDDFHHDDAVCVTGSAKLNVYDHLGGGFIENLGSGDSVLVGADSRFTMYGGELRDGVLLKGGRFDLKGGTVPGVNVPSNGTMNMSGGVVTSGGVSVSGAFNMTGGSITGCVNGGLRVTNGASVTLAGCENASITGNTRGGEKCNIYLEEGAKLTLTPSAPLDASARFGVTTAAKPTKTSAVVFTGALMGMDVLENFIPDDESLEAAVNTEGEAELRVASTGETDAVPVFRTHSLLLTGAIGVNFFMELPEGPSYSGAYMEFTVESKNGKTTRDVIDPDHRDLNGRGYYGFTVNVNAIQMAAPIHAVFHYGEGLTVEQTYSVKEYVTSYETVASRFDESTTALVRALADYGHYAQLALSDANGWTIGTDYAEMDVFYRSDMDYNAVAKAVKRHSLADAWGYYSWVTADNVTIDLNLLSETELRICVTPRNAYGAPMYFHTTDVRYMPAEKLYDGRYRVNLGKIAAHNLGTKIPVEMNLRGQGDLIYVSALTYVQSMLASSMDNRYKDCVCALYYYSVATTEYRAAHGY